MNQAVSNQVTTGRAAAEEMAGEARWTMRVPMVTDRFFLWDMLRWVALTGLFVSVLASLVFVFVGEAESLPMLLGILWMAVAGLFVFSYLIALVVFRNRYFVQYTVDETGIRHAMTGTSKNLVGTAAIGSVVFGALAGSPGAAGAGLLAASRSAIVVPWSEIRSITEHPTARVLSIRNRWRTLCRLRCPDRPSYERVLALVRTHIPA